jgi:membrane protein implicated in regulation of membrane protease activity
MDPEDVVKVAWVVLAVVVASAEIAVPGFFLLPFGLGAGAGAVAAFAGASFPVQLLCFVLASGAFFAGLRPLARRLNRVEQPRGVGANRVLHERGLVVDGMGPDDPGLVRIDREEWRAESVDGTVIEPGTRVEVVEIRGTRVLVVPVAPDTPPGPGPATHPEEGSPA